VLAVPVSGAYHQSMSNTYNLYGRPAAVLVQDGDARLITRRETAEDLLVREIVPTTTGAIA
jgi:diaminopimelate decarboxylase